MYNTRSSINEERYKKGILDIQILSIFTGVGAVAKIPKVKKVLETLKGYTKSQWDELAKKYGNEVAKVGDEALTFLEKSKLFVKGENALLRYSRKDGTFFMHNRISKEKISSEWL